MSFDKPKHASHFVIVGDITKYDSYLRQQPLNSNNNFI